MNVSCSKAWFFPLEGKKTAEKVVFFLSAMQLSVDRDGRMDKILRVRFWLDV